MTNRKIAARLLAIELTNLKEVIITRGIDKQIALTLSGKSCLFESSYREILDRMISDINKQISHLQGRI